MAQNDRTTGLVGNAAIKVPCRAATTANLTLSGEQTIDGVACVDGDRVLVKNQTTQTANGIYVVDTGSWERAKDFDGVHDVVKGSLVMVTAGTTNINTYWRVTTADTVDIDTDNITFEQAYMSDLALATFLQAGSGAVSRTAQDKLRDQAVSITDFMSDADRASLAALTQTDVTTALTTASATGKPVTGPYGNYQISSAVTFNSNLHLQGADTNQSSLVLTSTGQLLTGDSDVRFTGGFKIKTSVNSKTCVKVSNSRFYGDFSVDGEGGATGVTAVEWDTTTSIYHSAWLPTECRDVAVCNRITGAGDFNNNQLGADYTNWFTGTEVIRNENTLVAAANTFRGYCESFTNLITQATGAGSFRDNEIHLWPDTVTNCLNAAAGTTIGENHWARVLPADWIETGTGTINAQVFDKKCRFRVYLQTTNQTINDNTATKIEWNTENYDVGATFGLTPNFRCELKRAGTWQFYAQADISGNLAVGDRVQLHLYKDGAEIAIAKDYAASANGVRIKIFDQVAGVKGSYFEIYAFADENAGAGTHSIAATTGTHTYFTGTEL